MGKAPQNAMTRGAEQALRALRARLPSADPSSRIPDVPPDRLPRHIAVIMDGNGRWAEQRGLPREIGHRNGAGAVRRLLDECAIIGTEVVTIYSFSIENWKRPGPEVEALMRLCAMYCDGEREALRARNVRCRLVGRLEGLPPDTRAAIDRLVSDTASCTGQTLCLAINYGSRAEIAGAARSLASDAAAGKIRPDEITEELLESRLFTAGLPDPDLLIRTGGERRVSNFLLWQLSYAELYVTDVLWPDFRESDLHDAIRDFARRTRRFGALDPGAGNDPDA